MFLDIAHGPSAPQEVLTITVAVNRASRDVAFMSFIVPTTASPLSGLRIAFAALDEKGAGAPVKVTQTAILPFEECRSDGCVARVPGGVFRPSPVHPAIDLLQLFKSAHLVEFEYVVNGQAVRASTALRGFQISHDKVMDKEFGPVAPVPSRPAPAPRSQGIQTSM
ncbi:MAG: hypothetical protein U1E77_12270 [Inhella sp.]